LGVELGDSLPEVVGEVTPIDVEMSESFIEVENEVSFGVKGEKVV